MSDEAIISAIAHFLRCWDRWIKYPSYLTFLDLRRAVEAVRGVMRGEG